MQELKRYPTEARLERAEKEVVLKAVLRSNGSIEAIEIFQSSAPKPGSGSNRIVKSRRTLPLSSPTKKPQMTVKIPMSYRLEP
jgi:TonB family protein